MRLCFSCPLSVRPQCPKSLNNGHLSQFDVERHLAYGYGHKLPGLGCPSRFEARDSCKTSDTGMPGDDGRYPSRKENRQFPSNCRGHLWRIHSFGLAPDPRLIEPNGINLKQSSHGLARNASGFFRQSPLAIQGEEIVYPTQLSPANPA